MVEFTIGHLSASQINLYIQCGLKYRFQYVDLIPRPFKSSGLVFGAVVHSTTDWFHKQRKTGKRVALGDALQNFGLGLVLSEAGQ